MTMMMSSMRSVSLLLLCLATASAFVSSPYTKILLGPSSSVTSSTTAWRLYNSIEAQEAKFLELADASQVTPEMVYTLVYKPYTEEEGVHTTEYPKGSGQQAMLVFESLEDCIHMAGMLGAEPSVPGEPAPTPAPLEQLQMACEQMGWALKVVPEGSSSS